MKNQYHIAVVESFQGNSGFAKIRGGDEEGTLVLIEKSRCRITAPGFITREANLEMPSEGNEVVLKLDRAADPHEPRAYIWGGAYAFNQPKPARSLSIPAKLRQQQENEERNRKPRGRRYHNSRHSEDEDLRNFLNVPDLTWPDHEMQTPSPVYSGPRENPNRRRPRQITQGVAD